MTLIILGLSITLLVSCRPTKLAPPSGLPVSFEVAIPILTNHLLIQIKNKLGILDIFDQKKILFEPFIDLTSHQVVKVSRQIEFIIFTETQKKFGDKFSIKRLIHENSIQADYIMHGVLTYEPYREQDINYYHVISSVIHKNTGQVVAKSDVWISNYDLDFRMVIESPMIVQDSHSIAEQVVKLNIDAQVPKNYNNFLKVGALITQAETAYENKDYQTALALYTQFSKLQSFEKHKMMNAYIGLYQTNIHLGNWDAAEKAFAKMVALNFEEYNSLGIKFIFLVNKVTFDSKLKAQYAIWLRQIGQYLEDNNNLCLHIVGHSSRSGGLDYNCNLSLNRAKAIQQKLQPYYKLVKANSKTDAKAWSQNIVGSGTDDAQDAIDRRVEFKVVSCPVSDNLSLHNKIKSCVNSVLQ